MLDHEDEKLYVFYRWGEKLISPMRSDLHLQKKKVEDEKDKDEIRNYKARNIWWDCADCNPEIWEKFSMNEIKEKKLEKIITEVPSWET